MDIEPQHISDDYDTGLVVLAYAATVAPCLNSLDEMPRQQAVAILRRVALELPTPGMSRVSQQSRNGTSVSFRDIGSVFGKDERAALRALCGLPSSPSPAAPAGSFPAAGLVAAIWPESS